MRRRMIFYSILIVILAYSMTTCTRPLPPPGKNAPVIRGQQQDVYFYPAQGGVKNAQKVLFLPGDGGWEGLALDIAEEMSKVGYDVYGFDTKRYLESFTTDAGTLKEEMRSVIWPGCEVERRAGARSTLALVRGRGTVCAGEPIMTTSGL